MNNATMQQLKRRFGFTLVEVLVAVVLLGIFSIATTQVFFSIIRTQTKTESVQEVKQSGDYAFSVIETMIRNAKSVTSPLCPAGGSGESITIVNPDDGSTIFDCSGSNISSESATHPDLDLTGPNVQVSSCTFTLVCSAAAGSSSKYVYFGYTIQPTGVPTGDPLQSATQTYQGTVTIRNE